MKALSIRQPWAWLIANGYKDIENRTWNTKFRGRIYVHTGQRIDPNDFQRQREHVRKSGIMIPELVTGAVIGEVAIVDCVPQSDSPWVDGPYGLVLANPVAYDKPIPCKGQRGFFNPVQSRLHGISVDQFLWIQDFAV